MNSKLPRMGIGFDVHQLVDGRECIIGGVHIPYEKGLLGHSDADVLMHAIADAILGAVGLGDIGSYFPDTDPSIQGIDSAEILKKVRQELDFRKCILVNVDSVVIAQAPKLAPFRLQMKENIASALGVSPDNIGVKATTTEKLGFSGRKEGIAAQAVAMVLCPTSL